MAVRNRSLLVFILAVLFCVGLGFAFRHWWGSDEGTPATVAGLRLEPPSIVFPSPVLEYDTETARFTLRNGTKEAVIVKSIQPEYGRIKITNAEGLAVDTPFRVPAEASQVLAVQVSPEFLWGLQRIKLRVLCDAAGVEVPLSCEMEMNVKPGPRAYPDKVAVHGHQPGTVVRRTVQIYDAYPGSGVQFEDVTVSNPKAVRFELKPVPPEEAIDSWARSRKDPDLPRFGFMHRYSLQLSYTVPSPPEGSDWFHDTVRLVSKGGKTPPLVISILGRPSPAAYTVTPAGVTVYMAPGEQTFRRTLTCRIAGTAASDLAVVSAPKFVQVTFSKAQEGMAKIDIQCSLPPGSGHAVEGEIRVGAGPQKEVIFTIPVKIYRPIEKGTLKRRKAAGSQALVTLSA